MSRPLVKLTVAGRAHVLETPEPAVRCMLEDLRRGPLTMTRRAAKGAIVWQNLDGTRVHNTQTVMTAARWRLVNVSISDGVGVAAATDLAVAWHRHLVATDADYRASYLADRIVRLPEDFPHDPSRAARAARDGSKLTLRSHMVEP